MVCGYQCGGLTRGPDTTVPANPLRSAGTQFTILTTEIAKTRNRRNRLFWGFWHGHPVGRPHIFYRIANGGMIVGHVDPANVVTIAS